MGRCWICEQSSEEIAREIGVCRSCILEKPDRALPTNCAGDWVRPRH